MEGIPEAEIRDHEAQKQSGKKIMTAEGAESSDEEGGSSAKRIKTSQPPAPEASTANTSAVGSIPMTPMLGSPFMAMGPMSHYLGHIPMMGAMPQMQIPSGQVPSPQSTPKPLFPTPSSSTPSISSASKPAFAAYSSGGASAGAGATIVGESTVPKKSGVIATQAGSSKIMHPEEDLSLEELRARLSRYQKSTTMVSAPQVTMVSPSPVVTPTTAPGGMGIPIGHLPGMMIPMAMPHMALPPHMQMGMAPMGILRAPHMPGMPGGFSPYGTPLGFPMMQPRFR